MEESKVTRHPQPRPRRANRGEVRRGMDNLRIAMCIVSFALGAATVWMIAAHQYRKLFARYEHIKKLAQGAFREGAKL